MVQKTDTNFYYSMWYKRQTPTSIIPGGIKGRQFIEHMEYKGHLYGTTFEAVEQVQRGGKSCVLHLQPQSIKKLRGSKLKPYVILIKPPPFPRLQTTRRDPALQYRLSGVKEFKDDELSTMIRVSRIHSNNLDTTLYAVWLVQITDCISFMC